MGDVDARAVPADTESRERLAARGLDYRLIGDDEVPDFLRADSRGFLDAEPTQESIDDARAALTGRRRIGVYDREALQPYPVATEESWTTPLTVPGGELPMWAISAVTVAATHRRRGIARAMLEGELRAAADAGIAVAGLTVSEATIYGRYGFAPAAPVARVRIDARRAGWDDAEQSVRILFVDRNQLAEDLESLHERTRTNRLGDIAGWSRHWRQVAGLTPDVDKPRHRRGVRAVDARGDTVGSMAFRLAEGESFSDHTLHVSHLVAATPAARAALWRFAITYDLVRTVEADLQPIDDPLPWQVHDRRGVVQEIHDHGWLRILDVPAALRARSLAGAFGVRLRVTDPLGLADGSWTVAQLGADGVQVEPLPDGDQPDVTLDIGALSAAYLGSVSLGTLQAAGRVTGDPVKIAALSDALRTQTAPHLSIWY